MLNGYHRRNAPDVVYCGGLGHPIIEHYGQLQSELLNFRNNLLGKGLVRSRSFHRYPSLTTHKEKRNTSQGVWYKIHEMNQQQMRSAESHF